MTMLTHPPKTATKLLNLVVPSELRESLVGDLLEEFTHRVKRHEKAAIYWFWRQTMMTSTHYLSRYLVSENFLNKLVLLITVVLFPTLLLAVFWLSNVDETSEYIWESLLDGKMHAIVLTSEFWSVGIETVLNYADVGDIDMYINIPSAIWACAVFAVLYFRNKRGNFSAHQAAAWGATLMFLPYIVGLSYIQLNDLSPRQVGPVIAIMTISIIYIMPPLSWFVLKKIQPEGSS